MRLSCGSRLYQELSYSLSQEPLTGSFPKTEISSTAVKPSSTWSPIRPRQTPSPWTTISRRFAVNFPSLFEMLQKSAFCVKTKTKKQENNNVYAVSEVRKTWIVWKHVSQADNMSSAECALITEVPLTWGIWVSCSHRRLSLSARSSCHTPGNRPYLYPKVNIDSIWYVMNCVPTNSYIEAVTPSILECDCACRLGLEKRWWWCSGA